MEPVQRNKTKISSSSNAFIDVHSADSLKQTETFSTDTYIVQFIDKGRIHHITHMQ